MVTIAVLAIIVGIAAPSISTQLAQNQIKSTSNIVLTSISRAKTESAIKRSNIVW
ncbi:MAG: pilus assembly FimT family protein, partial [Psychrobacter celer]